MDVIMNREFIKELVKEYERFLRVLCIEELRNYHWYLDLNYGLTVFNEPEEEETLEELATSLNINKNNLTEEYLLNLLTDNSYSLGTRLADIKENLRLTTALYGLLFLYLNHPPEFIELGIQEEYLPIYDQIELINNMITNYFNNLENLITYEDRYEEYYKIIEEFNALCTMYDNIELN